MRQFSRKHLMSEMINGGKKRALRSGKNFQVNIDVG